MVFQLRFHDGVTEAVDELRGLTPEQLAALHGGQARLVVLNEQLEEVVLAEVQSSGEVMILAGLPKERK